MLQANSSCSFLEGSLLDNDEEGGIRNYIWYYYDLEFLGKTNYQ